MTPAEAKRVLETALLCAPAPLSLREMRQLFDDEPDVQTLRALLDEIARDWDGRGVELVAVASGWRFQTRPGVRVYLDRLHPERPARYSRAAMETLAIVAYRQPVTRGDIEDIRGVTVGSQIVKQLEDRGWIEAIGHRETPGRPALYATTRRFLDDLGLAGLDELPPIDGLRPPSAETAGDAVSLAPSQAALPLDGGPPPSRPAADLETAPVTGEVDAASAQQPAAGGAPSESASLDFPATYGAAATLADPVIVPASAASVAPTPSAPADTRA
ncbi:MAG: SMC-Scp complex subunit ScpB [Rubrivivax sp.]|jgi:segregation and condensation protein B|nr:SMC-Scp complex subunit ScpB [Rubrivivax sp.]